MSNARVVPVAVIPRRRSSSRILIAPVLVACALIAASCSGSDDTSGNIVPVNAPAPGVIYVSTADGDVQVLAAASGDVELLLSGSGDGESAVVDLAPIPSGGLYALLQDPVEALKIEIADVTSGGPEVIETPATTLACLDPHTAASTPVAHEIAGGGPSGTDFTTVAFAGGSVDSSTLDLVSVACPRWTAARDMVATAVPLNPTDPASIVTIVQTSSGERNEIGFEGCGTTPTSFSPDDQFLAVSLTCYSALWESSGLYLIPVSGLEDLGALDALTKLGAGLYGRTSWHPDGEWVAAVHADAIARQNIAQDLSIQPVGLQVIEVATTQIIDLGLADDAEPFSVTWLETELDG